MYNILIGGAAGQGIDTLGILIGKILCRKGYFIHSYKDYMSRIRGGHNFTQIRFGTEKIYSHWPILDVIIALDKETIEFHRERLNDGGIILCDESIEAEDEKIIQVPMTRFARELKNNRVAGTVAAGVLFKLIGESLDYVEEVFEEKWEKQTAESNLEAFKKGYDFGEERFEKKEPTKKDQIYINSSDAIALGALAAGVGFFASYPMSPATSIMTKLSMKQNDAKIVVEQVEDEISAINMALGASY